MHLKYLARSVLPAAALLAVTSAQAASVTFLYTESFGAVPPIGPAPFATATFDDGGSPGSVTLTMEVAATVGDADLTGLYFNLDASLDPDSLSFARISGTGPTAADTDVITPGTASTPNELRAGPDGFYDILFDFPPPPGQQPRRFNAGENLVYEITGIASLTAQSFNFFGDPGPGEGNPGPYLSVARFQQTGIDGSGSDFVGAVPVPAAVWLFGSGLLALAGIARRKLRS